MDLTLKGHEMTYNMRVAILVSCGNKYLVQLSENKEYYVLVGGRVKFKESLFAAASRETEEELGVKVNDLKLVGVNESFFEYDKENNIFQEYAFIFTATVPEDTIFNGEIDVVKMSSEELLKNEVYPRNIKRILEGDTSFKYQVFDEVNLPSQSDDLSFVISEDESQTIFETLNIRATGIIRKNDEVIVDVLGSFDGPIGGRMHQLETSLQGIQREVEEELGITNASYEFRGIAEDFFEHTWGDDKVITQVIHFIYEVDIHNQEMQETEEAVVEYMHINDLEYDRYKFEGTIPFMQDETVFYASGIDENVLREK